MDNKPVNNIKTLCADIVEKAQSGHPGAPIGLSQFIHILYSEYLNVNPDDPKYLNRDIFLLSNGHACVIQYVMNYLLGYLKLEDLKNFRQLNSLTPGHPEKNLNGIEISTGPLGQGVASSVGFAISCKILQKYGLNNKVYCVFGDGCYQEGISQESFSLCSKLGLDNITFIYDYNKNTIDGSTSLSMNEDVKKRFESLSFEVYEIDDDPEQIRKALDAQSSQPKVIILHTKIAKDTELEGSHKSHGSPLGKENIRKLKERFDIPQEDFFVSSDLVKAYEKAKTRMRNHIRENLIVVNSQFNDEENKTLRKILSNNKAEEIFAYYIENYKSENLATRAHLSKCLNHLKTNRILISGSADLTSSINLQINNTPDFGIDNYSEFGLISYGIREHAMFGISNGLAAHGIFTPIVATFLNFSSYGLGSLKIACLDNLKVIYVFSHDSILLGEDGPTHQPIECLAVLRALPNLITLRPCDGRETRSALAIAVKEPGPVALILTRQKVADLDCTINQNLKYCLDKYSVEEAFVEKGAYYLHKEPNHNVILIATGSEVELAFAVKRLLKTEKVSIISMISFELFEKQDSSYKSSLIEKNVLKVSIEALSTFGWSKYSDIQIGLDEFGRSAPGKDAYEFFGFIPERIANKITLHLNE